MVASVINTFNVIWPFLLVLGVLVFVHELGHFLVARWYGVRVITFSLGFGKKILKFTRGGTEYCISLVPLGGYVKLAGETVQDTPTGDPAEFLSKSKWIRFQVYLAGPVMNLAMAVIVLAFVRAQGADLPIYTNAPAVIGGVAPGSPAEQAGLKPGDRVVSVDGRDIPSWNALNMAVIPRPDRQLDVTVDRGGERVGIKVTAAAVTKYRIGSLGVLPVMRPQVIGVQAGKPAEDGGLRRFDIILAVGGERALSQPEIIKRIQKNGDKPLVFTVQRDSQVQDLSITPRGREGAAVIGAYIAHSEFEHVDPTLVQAFGLSVQENWDQTRQIATTLAGLFTRDTPVGQLMGPVAIAEISASAAQVSWLYLFELMATISLNLGLLNLLPIPILDGGQIAILSLEGLFRRDMSVRVKEAILLAGAAVIILLMVTVIFNDVARLIR
jgi:regulator of sigma E protease